MENNIKKQRYIYMEGQAIPVTEEVYLAYYQPIWRTHENARRHGQCAVNDWRKCQGDCGLCRHRTVGDSGSIDHLYELYALEAEDTDSDPADIVGSSLLCETLLEVLDKIDPDGSRIAQLLMDGNTDRGIAAILGISKSWFNERKARIRKRLREYLENNL